MRVQRLHQKSAIGSHDHITIRKGVLRNRGAGGDVLDRVKRLIVALIRLDRDVVSVVAAALITNGLRQSFESPLKLVALRTSTTAFRPGLAASRHRAIKSRYRVCGEIVGYCRSFASALLQPCCQVTWWFSIFTVAWVMATELLKTDRDGGIWLMN
jgi:hypothetical protein